MRASEHSTISPSTCEFDLAKPRKSTISCRRDSCNRFALPTTRRWIAVVDIRAVVGLPQRSQRESTCESFDLCHEVARWRHGIADITTLPLGEWQLLRFASTAQRMRIGTAMARLRCTRRSDRWTMPLPIGATSATDVRLDAAGGSILIAIRRRIRQCERRLIEIAPGFAAQRLPLPDDIMPSGIGLECQTATWFLRRSKGEVCIADRYATAMESRIRRDYLPTACQHRMDLHVDGNAMISVRRRCEEWLFCKRAVSR